VPFPVLTDPERNAYRAYGLMEGSIGQLVNRRIIADGVRATMNGTFLRRPTGATRQLPGTAIVDHTGLLLHLHHARDAADHLTSRELIDRARTLGWSAALPAEARTA
jgi:hypothetical protein